MRGEPQLPLPRRAVGRASLQRRLVALRVAVTRYLRCRAETPADDRAWAGRVLDDLDALSVAASVPRREDRS